VCRGCGAYTKPRNGKGDAYAYCKCCHPGVIERRWTRERVVEAMLDWHRRHGRLPSSTKNAKLFLRKIRLDTFAREEGISSTTLQPGLTLLEYFDADLSGRDFAHGKPDPEIFLTSARELGVAPEDAIVIEDAAAGIRAAKAGGMGAIGIARVDDAELLAAAHADIVVTSLDDVDLAALADGRLATKTT
jgi:beta-phosphoglucomutase